MLTTQATPTKQHAPRLQRAMWKPNSIPQTMFLASPADEALYGGAAGGGKSEALLMGALRHIDNPLYTAVIFRRTYSELSGANGLIDRSHRYYRVFGGDYNKSDHRWVFPSGAKIFFAHAQYEDDVYSYDGWEICHLAFDELTSFTAKQYFYLKTRNRAPEGSGLKAVTRASGMPNGDGLEWVRQYFVESDVVNTVKAFKMFDGVDANGDFYQESKQVPVGTHESVTRAFYPAKASDNPNVDPDYVTKLVNDPDPVRKARLLHGDWYATYSEGLVYPNFSHENIESVKYNPNLPLIWGVDDGFVVGSGKGTSSYHPRVILIGQVTPIGGLNVLDEYVVAGVVDYNLTIQEMLNRINPDTGQPYGVPHVAYIDSSATVFKATIYNIGGISTINATHRIFEGVRNVRRLVGGKGQPPLLKIHPRCKETIWEMGRYEMDLKHKSVAGEPTPYKVNDHCMDALRYMAWHLRYELG